MKTFSVPRAEPDFVHWGTWGHGSQKRKGMHGEQRGGWETWELKNEVKKGSTLPRPLSFSYGFRV